MNTKIIEFLECKENKKGDGLSSNIRTLLYNTENGIIKDLEFYINIITYYKTKIETVLNETDDPNAKIPFQRPELGDTDIQGAKYLYQFFVEGMVQYIKNQANKANKGL